MNRLLVRLYPADWRARYGDEFEALLDERPLGPFDVVDVALSAFDAHLRRGGPTAPGEHTRGVRMTLRNGGIAAIVGGGLWLISLAGASATNSDKQLWLVLFVIALCALVVAIIGLSAEEGRRQPSLIWAAVAVPLVGAAISVLGLVGMTLVGDRPFVAGVSPWNVWAFGTLLMILGSGLFALASLRVRTTSRLGSALLAIGAVIAIPYLMGIAFVELLGDVGIIVGVLGIGAFAAGWIWLGISAIRLDRSATASYREAIP